MLPLRQRSFAEKFSFQAALMLLCAVLVLSGSPLAAATVGTTPQGAPTAPAAAPAPAADPENADTSQDSPMAMERLFSPGYQTCMDEAAGVTTAMQDCMNAELDRLEKRVETQKARLAPTLSQERARAFTEAVTAWDTLRKSGSAAMFDPDGGTLSPLMASLWYLEQTARMARWVDSLQENAEP
jgi:hypothetical protein